MAIRRFLCAAVAAVGFGAGFAVSAATADPSVCRTGCPGTNAPQAIAYIEQLGQTNAASVVQAGPNAVWLLQDGTDNDFTSEQTGYGNTVTGAQYGNVAAAVTQTGRDHHLDFVQPNGGADLRVSQTGVGAELVVRSNGVSAASPGESVRVDGAAIVVHQTTWSGG